MLLHVDRSYRTKKSFWIFIRENLLKENFKKFEFIEFRRRAVLVFRSSELVGIQAQARSFSLKRLKRAMEILRTQSKYAIRLCNALCLLLFDCKVNSLLLDWFSVPKFALRNSTSEEAKISSQNCEKVTHTNAPNARPSWSSRVHSVNLWVWGPGCKNWIRNSGAHVMQS